jgi:multidrug efflux pump subunit AcrA (membrane-fusion protein)
MAGGMLKAAVRLPSDGEDAARVGHVEFLDNAVQNGSGTVNLRGTMGNPDRHFWPGQFVDVKLVLSTEKGAVLIPNQAAQISQKGSVVCRDRSVVGSPTRAGRKTNLLTIEKMVELAAMPRPMEITTAATKPGDLENRRHAWVRSFSQAPMGFYS